jgi:hypothetical protein
MMDSMQMIMVSVSNVVPSVKPVHLVIGQFVYHAI